MVFSKPTGERENAFVIVGDAVAAAHPCLDKGILKEFWHGFSCQGSTLGVLPVKDPVFCIGEASAPELRDADYAFHVEKTGLFLTAKDEVSLVRGYMAILDRMEPYRTEEGKSALAFPCETVREAPPVALRFAHLCVFPETPFWELEKYVRLCGFLRYTHLILEFWGTFRFDCLKELSWDRAFGKEDVKRLVLLARDLGMEVVPDFNHWGHAAGCRVRSGKHVVLDQDPTLFDLFAPDGWSWNLVNPRVYELHRAIRRELAEVCGAGSFFHIGCDEAYNYEFTPDNVDRVVYMINGAAAELKKEGRRAMIWGDMLLAKKPGYDPENKYTLNCPDEATEKLLFEKLDRSVIVADWQYRLKKVPAETSVLLKDAGFDVVLCDWDETNDTTDVCLATVKERGLYGFMHTTWHTLESGAPYLIKAAAGCLGYETPKAGGGLRARCGEALRKVFFADGDYEKAGHAKKQL